MVLFVILSAPDQGREAYSILCESSIPWSGVGRGAILPRCIDRHQYTIYDETRTRVWRKAYDNEMKKSSSSIFVPNRVIARQSRFMYGSQDLQAMGIHDSG